MRPEGLAPKPELVNPLTVPPKFLCDGTGGAVVKALRILGFNAEFLRDTNPNHLIRESNRSKRFLITTSHQIAERAIARYVIRIPQEGIKRQIESIEARIPLASWIAPFTRCIRCNEPLKTIPKDRIREMVPPFIWDTYGIFHICPVCDRVYWAGSHRKTMDGWVEELMSDEWKKGTKTSPFKVEG